MAVTVISGSKVSNAAAAKTRSKQRLTISSARVSGARLRTAVKVLPTFDIG